MSAKDSHPLRSSFEVTDDLVSHRQTSDDVEDSDSTDDWSLISQHHLFYLHSTNDCAYLPYFLVYVVIVSVVSDHHLLAV